MRGKTPVIAMVAAGVFGVAAGGWPVVTAPFGGDSGPSMRTQLAAVLGDQRWQTPKPGSWTMPAPAANGLPPVINHIETQDRVVFLTIDDGYTYDSEFVNLVRKEKVPILTFLTSTYIKGQGQYFWAMRNAGSQMENHTVSHPNMATLGAEAQKKQICDSSDEIQKQYGRRPQIFRPPFGSFNQTTLQVAKECGIKSVLLWSAEFYNGTTGPGVGRDGFARGDGGKGFKPGDIILMHYRKGLAHQFQMILGWIRQAGFRPAAVENYLPKSLGGNVPDKPASDKPGP
ncbi:polysaccharide deacetylase family protein [Actinomadura madurae]|uniref:polysaccharide deacetylase family protein n=1 Tax=Actinomadura madurae TaxID=1993 RepID=UPI002026C9FF|nr:polysaccharide deacetylase family protein [Actinomadura madurae]MCP9954921.1 polysaccharide deacetylase family protein [Actinomadura madurae]MCP9971663.1 polysaccharide deacetylase family protein [Actinomadura madurae]MCP9984159.1 polysaccharide deacetylase family protein [Actinomadura madurae]MCQ0020368.1 polysaccharide deacetylase family protein [Actinomadura madurae]URN00401.1 polysaccharide deacetylase family protein [Actinomadura madurae]